jgi:hypothetical protein
MAEEDQNHERPPNEAWWERELHRNEKLMDKYLAVLADNPDMSKFKRPEDLYNKVHYGIDPPEDREDTFDDEADADDDVAGNADEPMDAEPISDDDPDPFENDPPDNEGYPEIARLSRDFAVKVLTLEDRKEIPEILLLSAGKVGANLAGGHGLGYDEDSLCGNVVKCRWALADCEFCLEMLEQLARKTGRPEYHDLFHRSVKLAQAIRERVTRLRARVWW